MSTSITFGVVPTTRNTLGILTDIGVSLAKLNVELDSDLMSELVINLGKSCNTSTEELELLWSSEADPNMVVEGVSLSAVATMDFDIEQFAWYLTLNPKCLYDNIHMDLLFQCLPRRGTVGQLLRVD